MESNYLPLQESEGIIGGPSSRDLLRRVRLLYVTQFRRFFAITAPTSVIAAFVYSFSDQQVRALFRSSGNIFLTPFQKIAEAMLLRLGGYFVCWFLGCFALAAISTIVLDLQDNQDQTWVSDSHQRAREHFGAILAIALITLAAFGLGAATMGVVIAAIVKVVGWTHYARFNMTAALIGTVIVASIVSWLGMAIPLVLRGDIGVWSALKKSLEAADGRQGFLLLLVIESLIASYVAWYASHYALILLLPEHFRFSGWYFWISLVAFALGSAAAQPLTFVGFAVLADESSRSTTTFNVPS